MPPLNRTCVPSRDYPTLIPALGDIGYACAMLGMKGVMGHCHRWWEYATAMRAVRQFVPTGGRILEVGTGGFSSPFAAALALAGYHVLALEKELPFVLETAAQSMLVQGATDTVFAAQHGDLCTVDLATLGGTFDAVVSISVIEHVPDDLLFFRRCLECLTPGGLLVLTCDFSDANPGAQPTQERLYTKADLERLNTDHGTYMQKTLVDEPDWTTIEKNVLHYTFASFVAQKAG